MTIVFLFKLDFYDQEKKKKEIRMWSENYNGLTEDSPLPLKVCLT